MIKLKEETVWILNRKYLLDDCGETKCRILRQKIRILISSPYSKGHPDLLSNGRVYVSIACFREASQTLIDKIRCPHQFCHIHGRSAWLKFENRWRWVFQGQLLDSPGRLGWFQGNNGIQATRVGPPKKNGFQFSEYWGHLKWSRKIRHQATRGAAGLLHLSSRHQHQQRLGSQPHENSGLASS